MIIVHIITGLNVGGAELMLKRLIESHSGNTNYQHSVISLTNVGKVGLQLQALGVKVQALGMRSVLDTPRVLWSLVRMLQTSHPDVVQTWMYHADLLGGGAARLAGNDKIIWGIRTTSVKNGDSYATQLIRWLCAKFSHFVPHTIVCAADKSRQAHITIGYDASRMEVVPNGFNTASFAATSTQRQALRAQYGLDAEIIVAGYLGRFHPDKDQKNFVQAAGLAARQHSNVRFLMAGRGLDSDNTVLKNWISQTGHADRFILLGERDDVPVCLAAMDFFCLSSRTEGFPNVVGEAMAMGVPCVATDVGDTAMLVADTGVVVPKEDSAALAHGLGHLLTMTSHARQQLGQKARARIHAEFTIERAREQFESIYQRVTTSEPI